MTVVVTMVTTLVSRLRVVGYARVSTLAQAQGTSLAEQQHQVRAWCQREGHRLVAFCEDTTSGDHGVEDREGLARALAMLAGREADALVFHSEGGGTDRLSRQLHVQEAILQRAWASGARVFNVLRGEVPRDEPDDPYRTFIRQVLGAAAQLDKALTLTKLRGGRRRKRAAGGFGGGTPRYGQRASAGRLVTDANEERLVSRIRELRDEGASYRDVCAALAAEGFTPRRAPAWSPTVVRRIALRA